MRKALWKFAPYLFLNSWKIALSNRQKNDFEVRQNYLFRVSATAKFSLDTKFKNFGFKFKLNTMEKSWKQRLKQKSFRVKYISVYKYILYPAEGL